MSALSHLTVIEAGESVAGAHCAKLMAGFGARVIKVEPPRTGDRARSAGPFWRDEPGPESSIPFLWLNTSKESVTLDLERTEGRELFKRLVRRADVLIESFPPRVLDEAGLGWDGLAASNPRLVMTSISSFGQTGPYRDYEAEEITAYAASGLMYLTGDADRPPLAAGAPVAQSSAALNAYVATLMAVYQRETTGRGQHVDVSIQECALDNIEIALVEHLHEGKVARRNGDEHPLVPWKLYACADGHAAVIGGPVRHWRRGADLFEEPRLLDERYAHMADRIKHRPEVDALISPWLARQPRKDVYHAGQARGMAFGYVADLSDVVASPQHRARGYFEPVDHPVVGTHEYCGAPWKLARTPWRTERAPLLGEHNRTVYGDWLGCTADELIMLARAGVI